MTSKYDFNTLTGRVSMDLTHPDLILPFKELQTLAKNEIGADLQIISGFRGHERQEAIWNAKASGERIVLDDSGNKVCKDSITTEEFIEKIMRFSAIPGASRHHWGSDLDIYDAYLLPKDKVQLLHSECIEGGVFSKLHIWLDELIQSDNSLGFYRPYNKDLGGVAIEKWHLSYRPVSDSLYAEYDFKTFTVNIKKSNIIFKDIILKNARYYFDKFVVNIEK